MLLLREVTKDYWLESGGPDPQGAPADVLRDFRTRNNGLSVWGILDDEGNIEPVIAALVLNKTESLSEFDFILFDSNLVESLGITMINNPAPLTVVPSANEYHHDLENLSAKQVSLLADELFKEGLKSGYSGRNIRTYTEDDLQRLIESGIQRGLINCTKINRKMLSELKSRGIDCQE